MSKDDEIKIGDVVQVNPAYEQPILRGCFLVVEEAFSWGVQGFVLMPHTKHEEPKQLYWRLHYSDIERIGVAAFVPLEVAKGMAAEQQSSEEEEEEEEEPDDPEYEAIHAIGDYEISGADVCYPDV